MTGAYLLPIRSTVPVMPNFVVRLETRRKALRLLKTRLVPPLARTLSPPSATLGRLGFSMDCKVLEVVEEVALQRPRLAVVGTAGMLAWISPEPARHERGGIAVFVGRGWWIVVLG